MGFTWDVFCDQPNVALPGQTVRSMGQLRDAGTISGIYSSVLGGPMPFDPAPKHRNDGCLSAIVMGQQNVITGGAPGTPGGTYNTVLNGLFNNVSCVHAAVLGGQLNRAGIMTTPGTCSCYHSIVNGCCNTVNADCYSVIANGGTNSVSGFYSSILNGLENTVIADRSHIGTGRGNSIHKPNPGDGCFDSIFNGRSNTVSGCYNSIFNGLVNCSSGLAFSGSRFITVAAGECNSASGNYAFIGNGGGPAAANCNQATANCSFIGNGAGHTSSGGASFTGNGECHTMTGQCSGIVSGCVNTVNANDSFVGGGGGNCVQATFSVVGGGGHNFIGPVLPAFPVGGNSISGGCENTIIGTVAPVTGARPMNYIGGGRSNTITLSGYSSIAGGCCNLVLNGSHRSFIGGGILNCATIAVHSVIGGGDTNTIRGITPLSVNSAILGGGQNCVVGGYSAIAGGEAGIIGVVATNPQVPGDYSFIGGGSGNTIQTDGSAILGGSDHLTPNILNFIGGGLSNSTSSNNYLSVVMGGENNAADSSVSFFAHQGVLTGLDNTSCGNHAVIMSGVDGWAHSNRAFIGNGVENCMDDGDGNSVINGRQNCITFGIGFCSFFTNTISNGYGNAICNNVGPSRVLNTINNGTTNAICDGSFHLIASGANQIINGVGCLDSFIGHGENNLIYGFRQWSHGWGK